MTVFLKENRNLHHATQVILTIEAEGSKFMYFFKKTIIIAIVCFFSTVHFLFFNIGALPVGFNQRVTKKKRYTNFETPNFIYSNINIYI